MTPQELLDRMNAAVTADHLYTLGKQAIQFWLEDIQRYRDAIENLHRLDLQWQCKRFPNDDDVVPRRNCRNTGSDPCEVCVLFLLLDKKI